MTATLLDDIVTDAKAGLTLDQSAARHKCAKRTLQRICKANHIQYNQLKPPRKKIQIKSPSSAITTPPTCNDPPVSSVSPQKPGGELNPYMQEILQIQKAFVGSGLQCNVKDAIDLRDRAQRYSTIQDIPAWVYPPKVIATKRQMEIIQAIVDPSLDIILIEGDKRTGKSTVSFLGICQGVWEGRFKRCGLWASGEENALGILENAFHDELSVKETAPLFKGEGSSTQKVFWNNAVIKAHSNKAASTSGLDFDVCWSMKRMRWSPSIET